MNWLHVSLNLSHSPGLSGTQLLSEDEGSFPLDFPLLHDMQS
jgi:hypothetical protein